ncbi:zinc c3hc4 type [Stylonychia lemnae]|uniref:Zinc c3hc4 type n=1 Tax=Stylonychia lemnae TaxID=5949 RepID=A0A078BBB7_STYLE|nr:zinc c3hc4 type [Stylonychia lemnae]|eukprot:CDW91684.1 zinc c3hc4 type [Stylonychia lemnae]
MQYVTDIYARRGSLNILSQYLISGVVYGLEMPNFNAELNYINYYDDLAGNQTQTTSYQQFTIDTQVKLRRFYQDSRIQLIGINDMLWKNNFKIGLNFIGEYKSFSSQFSYELANFQIESSEDVKFDMFRDQSDIYYFYFLVRSQKRSRILSFNTSSLGSEQIRISQEIEVPICGDEIIVREHLIIVQCTSQNEIRVYQTKNMNSKNYQIQLTNPGIFASLYFTQFDLNLNLENTEVFVISRLNHYYICYLATLEQGPFLFNQKQITYQLYMVEGIFADNSKLLPHTGSIQLIYSDSSLFNAEGINSNQLLITQKNKQSRVNMYQMCFYDQFKSGDTCKQCQPNSFSLSFNSPSCTSCNTQDLKGLSQAQLSKLNYLCANNQIRISRTQDFTKDLFSTPISSIINKFADKIPQNISDIGKGETGQTKVVNQDLKADITTIISKPSTQEEQSIPVYAIVMIVVLPSVMIIIFVLIILKVVQIMKQNALGRLQRQNIQNQAQNTQALGPESPQKNDKIRQSNFEKVKSMVKLCKFSELTDNHFEQKECIICFEQFQGEDEIRVTQCQHIFHSQCILEWAKNRIWTANSVEPGTPICPCCNQSLLIEIKLPHHIQDQDKILIHCRSTSVSEFQILINPSNIFASTNQSSNQSHSSPSNNEAETVANSPINLLVSQQQQKQTFNTQQLQQPQFCESEPIDEESNIEEFKVEDSDVNVDPSQVKITFRSQLINQVSESSSESKQQTDRELESKPEPQKSSKN